MHFRIEKLPELGALRLGVPLSKLVAEREDPLFGSGLFFIAPRTANAGIEAELFYGFQQRDGLRSIAGIVLASQDYAPPAYGILHTTYDEALAQLRRPGIPKGNHFREVVAGVDMQERKRETAWAKCFFRQAPEHDGILASGEHAGRCAARRCD